MVPSGGFKLQFLAGVWALVLVLDYVDVDSCVGALKKMKGTDSQSADNVPPDNGLESDDSMSEYEKIP